MASENTEATEVAETTETAQAVTPVVGAHATFKGYANLEEGMDELLKVGQRVEIMTIEGDEGMTVVGINENNERLNLEGGVWQKGEELMGDRVFAVELENFELPATEQAVPQTEAGSGSGEGAVVDVSALKGKALEDAYGKLPGEIDGWAKMKVGEKRAALAKALAGGDEIADVSVTDEVPEVPEVPATTQGSDLIVTISDSQSVIQLLAEKDAISAAKYLLTQEQKTLYTLGGVLKHVNETGAYKSLGYDGKNGFNEFCENELGVKYRKAMYMITIYSTFQQIGVAEDELERIGWSKLAELARIPVDKLTDDLDDLLTRAKSGTRDGLVEHIKEHYEVATQAARVKKTKFSFSVVEAEGETVRRALDHAKTLAQTDDINVAFLHVCGDWMNNAQGTDLDLNAFVALAVSRFGREAIEARLAETEDEEGNQSDDTADLERALGAA